jgi:hypothetical protein
MPWRLGKKSRSCVLFGMFVSKNCTSLVIRLSISTNAYRPSLLLTTDTRKRSSVSSKTHTHRMNEDTFMNYNINEEFHYRDRVECREKDLFRVCVSKVYKVWDEMNKILCVCVKMYEGDVSRTDQRDL